MKWKLFTDEQLIAVLQEHETGLKIVGLAQKAAISEAT